MGMAASQARLLCLTARMHDVEYAAQSIQNAKTELATQSDQVYSEYLAALDATTLTLTKIDPQSGEKAIVAANFNNLVSRNRLVPADGSEYLLRDNKGRLIVEEEMYEGYQEFINTYAERTPYMFAMFMLGELNDGDYDSDKASAEVQELRLAEGQVCESLVNDGNIALRDLRNKVLDLAGVTGEDRDSLDAVYDTTNMPSENKSEYDAALKNYLRQLYKNGSNEMFNKMFVEKETSNKNTEDFDPVMFNYYVNVFQEIQSCGGAVSITDYNGFDGDAANDSDWLQSMVQCGQISIQVLKTDKRTGDVILEATSPSSDISVSYTTTSQIDQTAVAKAEAKYNHSLKEIDRKDKKYDMTLSKLETERKALDTQRESLKKVIEENIDRTFGIFS